MAGSMKDGAVRDRVIDVLMAKPGKKLRVSCVGDMLTCLGTNKGIRPDQLIGVLRRLKQDGVIRIAKRPGGVTEIWLRWRFLALQ